MLGKAHRNCARSRPADVSAHTIIPPRFRTETSPFCAQLLSPPPSSAGRLRRIPVRVKVVPSFG
jgi:hypothetical protein